MRIGRTTAHQTDQLPYHSVPLDLENQQMINIPQDISACPDDHADRLYGING